MLSSLTCAEYSSHVSSLMNSVFGAGLTIIRTKKKKVIAHANFCFDKMSHEALSVSNQIFSNQWLWKHISQVHT